MTLMSDIAVIKAGKKGKARIDLEEPPMWQVVFHNDPVTTMAFVTAILMKLFGMDETRAKTVMMQVHVEGAAIAEVCPFELAETKAYLVLKAAEASGYPFKVTCERA